MAGLLYLHVCTVLNSLGHVCQTIPRHVLEGTYGINIIRPREDEDPDRTPTYEEVLMAYGCELMFFCWGRNKNRIDLSIDQSSIVLFVVF